MRLNTRSVVTAALAAGWAALVLLAPAARAAETAATQPAAEKARKTLDKAVAYLKSKQDANGEWHTQRQPSAVSAMVLWVLVAAPGAGPADPGVKKGYEKLLTYQQPDGGIYNSGIANYNTAVSLAALAASGDPAHKAAVDKALAFLRKGQFSEDTAVPPGGAKVDEKSPVYGGWNYGAVGRGAGFGGLRGADDRGRQGGQARLARGADRPPGVDPERRRELRRRGQVDGGQPDPGDVDGGDGAAGCAEGPDGMVKARPR